MSTTPTGPPDTNATAATAATAAATVTPSDPKILLQITKNSEYFTTSKNPSYNVNVLSYYDGTNLQNSTDRSYVDKLLLNPENKILLIENNKEPVEIKNTTTPIIDDAFRKFKPPIQQTNVKPETTTSQTITGEPVSKPNIFTSLINKVTSTNNAKVSLDEVTPKKNGGGKRKTIRKKSYKKSARRNLTRRS